MSGGISTSTRSRSSSSLPTPPPLPSPPELELERELGPEPYSIYTPREKSFIVLLIAFSALFSPLTSNVYFPAIPIISNAFHKSTELINLSVTTYMIFQGISPMLFGTLADYLGRRMIYCSCLLILSLTCIGLALCPTTTNGYALLLFLRCLQATGSASTIALGAGVIGDIAERHERAGFFGVYQSGPLLAPAIGPVIGGALSSTLGWRSIFSFLSISSGITFLIILTFLPETLRSIVGNGSIRVHHKRKITSFIYQPLIRVIGRGSLQIPTSPQNPDPNSPQIPNPPQKPPLQILNPFQILLLNPSITLILIFNSTINATYYALTTTLSTLFFSAYPFLTSSQVGLCFLSIGGGMFLGSLVGGRVLDWEYGRVGREWEWEREGRVGVGVGVEERLGGGVNQPQDQYPIEKARLRLIPYLMIPFVASTLSYGWCIQHQVPIAIPLILQFIVGLTSIMVMNACGTYVVDLVPGRSAGVSGCNNLFRSTLAAILVSTIDLIASPSPKGLGVGWAFGLLGCVCAGMTPIVWVVMRMGERWRERDRERERERGV
ncbi:major facilitator superfamily domain-containing protein [Lentinula aff. detonsa]|uniref:Major facilitator superfamily domain-containing protein n=1 Tax=Lentinula aff. detonsa TaxID=2804958 RepID=A0AA38NCV4_9AGAR|nr:major facilitator superfamily domain-containing protein [Lentinula aff. detonsa]